MQFGGNWKVYSFISENTTLHRRKVYFSNISATRLGKKTNLNTLTFQP